MFWGSFRTSKAREWGHPLHASPGSNTHHDLHMQGELGEKYQGEINPYLLKKETEREKLKSEFKSCLFF